MTSTPVTGSQNSQLMNFVSKSQQSGKSGASPFDALMNSIGNNKPDLSSNMNAKPDVSKAKMSSDDNMADKPAELNPVSKDEKVERPVTEDDVKNVKDAVSKVADKIKDELSVTDEDIKQALENLGLEMTALLIPDFLPKIIAELTGTDDVLSLATDEDLYNSLCEITETVNEVTDELLNELGVSKDEFLDKLKAAVSSGEGEMITDNLEDASEALNNNAVSKDNSEQNNSRPTYSRFERVHISAQVEETKLHETEVVDTDLKKSGNDFLKDFTSNRNQVSFMENLINEVTNSINEVEETVTYTTFDTVDIINQIAESIKIDVSSDVSEISLRLHPESLGTVSVKVSANNEGVLTATFTAQNESVKAIIESQAVVLKETLESKGVTVEAVEVMVQSHGFERNLSDNSRQNNQEQNPKKKGLRRIDLTDPIPEELETEDDSLVREMMAQNGNTVDYSA